MAPGGPGPGRVARPRAGWPGPGPMWPGPGRCGPARAYIVGPTTSVTRLSGTGALSSALPVRRCQ